MKSAIEVIVLAVTIAGCSKHTLDMPSAAMEPTVPAGSIVTIDFDAYKAARPARFDIVAFRPVSDPNAIFIRRAIGLPGETIQIGEQALLINGNAISPPNGLCYVPLPSGTTATALKADEYFVLGDNPNRSRDSRHWGYVPGTNMVGRVIEIEH